MIRPGWQIGDGFLVSIMASPSWLPFFVGASRDSRGRWGMGFGDDEAGCIVAERVLIFGKLTRTRVPALAAHLYAWPGPRQTLKRSPTRQLQGEPRHVHPLRPRGPRRGQRMSPAGRWQRLGRGRRPQRRAGRGPQCGSCRDCGNHACVGGTCGACVNDSDCCSPLQRSNGTCIDVVIPR
jgi:hypothetical protein